jgi:hypothetical protein
MGGEVTPEQEARRLQLEEELRWMAAERRRETRLMLAGVVERGDAYW